MKLEAIGHRVLIQLIELKDEYKTFLEIADPTGRHASAVSKGKVVDIGPQAYKDFGDGTPWCAKGDKVLITQYSGREIKDGDTRYVIVNDNDILVKYED